MTPTGYLTVAAAAVVALTVLTPTGRYLLRRVAITLAVVALGAVLVLDGRSPI